MSKVWQGTKVAVSALKKAGTAASYEFQINVILGTLLSSNGIKAKRGRQTNALIQWPQSVKTQVISWLVRLKNWKTEYNPG